MKKVFMSVILISSLLMPLSASAFDIKNLNFLSNKKSNTNATRYTPISINSTISTLRQDENQILAVDTQMTKSFLAIVSLILPKDEFDFVRSKVKLISDNSAIDATQRRKQFATLVADFTANVVENQNYISSKIASMSDVNKANLIQNIALLSKGVSKYSEVASQYSEIVSTHSKLSANNTNKIVDMSSLRKNASVLKYSANSINNFLTLLSDISKSSGTGALLFNK